MRCLGFLVCFVGMLWSTQIHARATSIQAVDAETLRVCADPANMPFSNKEQEGFENDIARLLAQWLKKDLSYDWFPQAIGYVRNTLNKKRLRCFYRHAHRQ